MMTFAEGDRIAVMPVYICHNVLIYRCSTRQAFSRCMHGRSSILVKPMSDYRFLSADIIVRFFSSEKNRTMKHVTLHNA